MVRMSRLFDGGYERQSDAGIATGGFNNDRAGSQNSPSLLFGIFHHGQSDAVLHSGIEALQLGDDLCLYSFGCFQMARRRNSGCCLTNLSISLQSLSYFLCVINFLTKLGVVPSNEIAHLCYFFQKGIRIDYFCGSESLK